jgi:hypothetical protein
MSHQIVAVDGIDMIGLHNGLYRISFYVLGADGAPRRNVELVVGLEPLKEVVKALQQLSA